MTKYTLRVRENGKEVLEFRDVEGKLPRVGDNYKIYEGDEIGCEGRLAYQVTHVKHFTRIHKNPKGFAVFEEIRKLEPQFRLFPEEIIVWVDREDVNDTIEKGGKR